MNYYLLAYLVIGFIYMIYRFFTPCGCCRRGFVVFIVIWVLFPVFMIMEFKDYLKEKEEAKG